MEFGHDAGAVESRRADRGNSARWNRKDDRSQRSGTIRAAGEGALRSHAGRLCREDRSADRDRTQLGAGQTPSAWTSARVAQADRSGAGRGLCHTRWTTALNYSAAAGKRGRGEGRAKRVNANIANSVAA